MSEEKKWFEIQNDDVDMVEVVSMEVQSQHTR